MKLFKISIALLIMLCSLLCSCVDSDYHWDNINTEGVLQIPPVPLGTYKAIKIKDLGSEVIEIEGIPSVTIEYSYVLENIFGTDVVKDFFHPDMTRDLSIEGILDLNMLGVGNDEEDGVKISLGFGVLKSNNDPIDNIEIDGISEDDIKQGEQILKIAFSKDDGGEMKNAQHLLIKIKMRTQGTITLRDEDYIQLKNLVIKTGGYHVNL